MDERPRHVQQCRGCAARLHDARRGLLGRLPHRRRERAGQLRADVRRERLDGRQHVVLPHRHQPVQRERERGVHRPDGRDDARDESPARGRLRLHHPGGPRRLLLRQARLEPRRVRRHRGSRRPGEHRPRRLRRPPGGRGTGRRPVRRPDLQLGGLQRRGREGRLRQRGAPALDVHALDRCRDGRRWRRSGRCAEPSRWAERDRVRPDGSHAAVLPRGPRQHDRRGDVHRGRHGRHGRGGRELPADPDQHARRPAR